MQPFRLLGKVRRELVTLQWINLENVWHLNEHTMRSLRRELSEPRVVMWLYLPFIGQSKADYSI